MTSTDQARRRGKVTPIYVIAGFLGSGKTTLLKRALAHELDKGVKPVRRTKRQTKRWNRATGRTA
jgi:molybdopterin-guanine dinucleotide biosynthesis protein